jgi:hypothetical protein
MEIADLVPDTTYIFQIFAGNVVGYGSASKIRVVTPTDVVEKPQEHERIDDKSGFDDQFAGSIIVT